MTVSDSIEVTYSSSEGGGSECTKKYGLSYDLVYGVVPTFSYYIYLWTKTHEEGNKYALYLYDDALGMGQWGSATEELIEKRLTFSFDSSPSSIKLGGNEIQFGDNADVSFAQETLSFPAKNIVSVEALTPILALVGSDMQTLYSKGEIIPVGNFELSPSGLCVTPHFAANDVFGTVKIKYNRVRFRKYWEVYDRLEYGANQFFLYREGVFQESITITKDAPSDEDQPTTDRTIQLLIVDHSELTGISGASVYLDGSLAGTTDASGSITVDTTAGSHSLRVTASGYLDSDADNLSNETIVID